MRGGRRDRGESQLTADGHFAAAHQVTLVPHQDDGRVAGGPVAAQGDAQLGGPQEGGAVRDGVQQQVGIARLHALVLGHAPSVLLHTHTHTHTCLMNQFVYPESNFLFDLQEKG